MSEYVLFSTRGCHLCELAENLLRDRFTQVNLRWQTVEIADQDHLVDNYGVRIPVLRCCDSGRELDWPFDEQQLAQFIGR